MPWLRTIRRPPAGLHWFLSGLADDKAEVLLQRAQPFLLIRRRSQQFGVKLEEERRHFPHEAKTPCGRRDGGRRGGLACSARNQLGKHDELGHSPVSAHR